MVDLHLGPKDLVFGLWLVAFGFWFMTALGGFLGPFLDSFRAQVGAKLAQVGTKLAQVGSSWP